MEVMNEKNEKILAFVGETSRLSSRQIYEGLEPEMGYATVKRALADLLSERLLVSVGKGRSTKYQLSPEYELLYPINVDTYFEKEIDEREIQKGFNFTLIEEVLSTAKLFTEAESDHLNGLQRRYQRNVSELTEQEYNRELERLAIDLSWKSSQIEGNTYSLLETERLLKEKETAEGKGKDEATMLLNHKEALDFIIEHPDYVTPLALPRIEDIHSILMKDLGVDRNIRRRRVGITGTNYQPLDNEYQIRDAMRAMCDLVNNRESVFEKALLLLVLISYIQAFSDGNKRTARIMSNAILIAHHHCSISFRTISPIDYKKAMLIFYERNNIAAFKKIFIEQFEFAVNTYF